MFKMWCINKKIRNRRLEKRFFFPFSVMSKTAATLGRLVLEVSMDRRLTILPWYITTEFCRKNKQLDLAYKDLMGLETI